MQPAGTQKWLSVLCVLRPPRVWSEECAGLEPRWWSGRKPQSENRGGRGQGMSGKNLRWAGPQYTTKCCDDRWRSLTGHRGVCLCRRTLRSVKRIWGITSMEKQKVYLKQSWKKQRYVVQPKPAPISFVWVAEAHFQMCLTSWQNQGNVGNGCHHTTHTDTQGGESKEKMRMPAKMSLPYSWGPRPRQTGGCWRLRRCLKSTDVRSMLEWESNTDQDRGVCRHWA